MKKIIIQYSSFLTLITIILFQNYSEIGVEKAATRAFFAFVIFLYLYIHVTLGVTSFFNPLIPFLIYSLFFWWLPFFLLLIFSTYRVQPEIYAMGVQSFIILIFGYQILSVILKSNLKRRFNLLVWEFSIRRTSSS